MNNDTHVSQLTAQLGFWAASFGVLLVIGFTICFVTLVSVDPIFMWTDLDDYLKYTYENPSPLPDIARLLMLLVGGVFVVLFHCIVEYAKPEKKILARIGLSFGLGFAVLTGAHYFIQISAVRLSLMKGELAGIEQVLQANPYSAISAMNMLGWTLFLGLASLFVAPVFAGSRWARVARCAFLFNGVNCLLGGAGYLIENFILLLVTMNLGLGGAMLLIMIGLGQLFKRSR